MEQLEQRKRRFGDRYDGYRVKNPDPLFHVIPHIMRSRLDSQVFFEEEIDITNLREFIVKYKNEIPNLSTYHIFVAAMLRTIVQKPRLNRFVSGGRIFARNYLRASLTVKTSISEDADESLAMPNFEPTDTLREVVIKINAEVEQAKKDGETNDTDNFVKILNMIPNFVRRFVVWSVRSLDNMGLMPKFINRLSPFHSSVFVTNVGSIGLSSVYHHLYEFGTTSIFLAIGKKETKNTVNSSGEVESKKIIKVRFVVDERICDGYYYAVSIKQFKRYMKNPELLLNPPEYIGTDC